MVATDTLVNDLSQFAGFLLLFSGLMLKFWTETRFLNLGNNLNLYYVIFFCQDSVVRCKRTLLIASLLIVNC